MSIQQCSLFSLFIQLNYALKVSKTDIMYIYILSKRFCKIAKCLLKTVIIQRYSLTVYVLYGCSIATLYTKSTFNYTFSLLKYIKRLLWQWQRSPVRQGEMNKVLKCASQWESIHLLTTWILLSNAKKKKKISSSIYNQFIYLKRNVQRC